MVDTAPNASNTEQIDFWNGDAGVMWARRQDRMDALLAPITRGVLQACDVKAGERALDVGCGCGDTTIALAQRGARLTGVDVSRPMLARARERAQSAGLDIDFVLGDAAEARFANAYDALFSRFGVMFFADPTAAFANLHSAMRAKARLCFVCWQVPQANPWIAVPFGAALPMMPPQPPPDPRAPGPFAFAESAYVGQILRDAGFTDVRIDALNTDLGVGGNLDAAVEMICEVGPLSRSLASLDPDARAPIVASVRNALAPYVKPSGVMLGAACWIVRATA